MKKKIINEMLSDSPDVGLTMTREALVYTNDGNDGTINIINVEDMYYSLWNWMFRTFKTKPIVPPAYVIDRNHDNVEENTFEIDGKRITYHSWTNACNSIDWICRWKRSSETGEKKYTQFMPTNTKIILNPKCIKKSTELVWGDGPVPTLVMKTYLAHLIVHEICHYMTSISDWRELYSEKVSKIPVPKLMEDFMNTTLARTGTYDDEFSNEKITMSVMQVMFGDLFMKRSGLIPVIGGPFDLFKRERDVEWWLVATTLDVILRLNYLEFFDTDSDAPKDQRELGKRYDKDIKWIVREHCKWAKKHNDRFRIKWGYYEDET